jgi:hypothetical protein
MGAHVKASTLSDTHDVADIDALVGGRAYDKPPIISRAAFEPPLDLYLASLSKGQRISGWVVFDVPPGTASSCFATCDSTRLRSGPTEVVVNSLLARRAESWPPRWRWAVPHTLSRRDHRRGATWAIR